MRKIILLTVLSVFLFCLSAGAEEKTACAPEYQAMIDHAVVSFKGEGELDVAVVTDPFCWHCRLGHKLLSEFPAKYRSVKLAFAPREQFVGSDMACWILEDSVGSDSLKVMIDYAYSDLKRPKTDDLLVARMLVLTQFVERFPALKGDSTLEDLFIRLQKDHEAHVLEGARLSDVAAIPGTPVLLAGKNAVLGYGAQAWLKAMDDKAACE